MDSRPLNCRFRLQEEGKSYPRSSCVACGKNIGTGLGASCTKGHREEMIDAVVPSDEQDLLTELRAVEALKTPMRIEHIKDARYCIERCLQRFEKIRALTLK